MTTDLQKLESLLEKATPGPWEALHGVLLGGHILIRGDKDYAIAKVYDEDLGMERVNDANATLIVAAVNALPDLISEITYLRKKVEAFEEALDPDVTKAAYHGEFDFDLICVDEDGEEFARKVYVPWTTTKEIMAAIRARASLPTPVSSEGEV